MRHAECERQLLRQEPRDGGCAPQLQRRHVPRGGQQPALPDGRRVPCRRRHALRGRGGLRRLQLHAHGQPPAHGGLRVGRRRDRAARRDPGCDGLHRRAVHQDLGRRRTGRDGALPLRRTGAQGDGHQGHEPRDGLHERADGDDLGRRLHERLHGRGDARAERDDGRRDGARVDGHGHGRPRGGERILRRGGRRERHAAPRGGGGVPAGERPAPCGRHVRRRGPDGHGGRRARHLGDAAERAARLHAA